MKFINALLIAAIAFVGINSKCVEEANEEFFLLPVTSKARAEERCIENGGRLAEINDKNQNNAASAIAACTEAEAGSVDVWIKSWNGDSYNNVGILMNVNKENKGFTIHQYFEFFNKRDGIFEIEDTPVEGVPTEVADEPVETPTTEPTEPVEPQPTEPVVEPVETQPVEPVEPVEPQPEEPVEPQPVEPVEPQPEEPVEPQPVEPVEPQPEEPVEPQPVEPVEPQPEEPVEPQPVEPVEPQPEEPIDQQPVFIDDGVGTKYEVLCQVA